MTRTNDKKAIQSYSSPDSYFNCVEIVEEELSEVQAMFGKTPIEGSKRQATKIERRTELETLYRPFVPASTRGPKPSAMTDCFRRSLECFLGVRLKRPREPSEPLKTGEETDPERLEFDASSEGLVASPRQLGGEEGRSIQRVRYRVEYELKGRPGLARSVRNTSGKIAGLGACLLGQFVQPVQSYMEKLLNVGSFQRRLRSSGTRSSPSTCSSS